MVLLLKLVMRGKDMFLKKNKFIFVLLIVTFFPIQLKSLDHENSLNKIFSYLNSLNNFSASFVQNENDIISEGEIYIGNERVRLNYKYPSEILIILDKDKAMYYNYDLNEDEFFNPKDTSAWFFFEIFKNKNFFLDADISTENNSIILSKKGFSFDEFFQISLFFEDKPLVIRKIKLFFQNNEFTLSIYNHNLEKEFDDRFFKLINPTLLN